MSDFWKEFWINHSRATASDHLQRQVLRTKNKQPISDTIFQEILKDIEEKIEVNRDDTVLDLCCGNGLITTYLAPKCAKIIGVDFAQELTLQIDLEKHPNISIIISDMKKVQFEEESFDKAIIYSGLQYLTLKEAIHFFESAIKWLKRDGVFFAGDVPDSNHLWDFSDNDERQAAYFDALKNDIPFIGTWFEPEWLKNLGKYVGFTQVDILAQPTNLPYSHYRFDMLLRK
jgi:cyclopropane fatty-acyl-phospholipid synthase-like methyltransferase